MFRFPFFNSKAENFLILEISENKTSGILLGVDEEKNLHFKKTWENFFWSKAFRHLKRKLEKWSVVVSVSPALAATILVPAKLDRDSELRGGPLSAVELENLLAQATARLFNQCRVEASRALGIDELDTILISNRAVSFKVDGHQVVNPVDFKVKHLEAILEFTLTTRDIFESWKNFFNVGQAQNFFFTESSQAELGVLRRVKALPVNLVMLDMSRSFCFTLGEAHTQTLARRIPLEWKAGSIIEAIASAWGVDSDIAFKLYASYLKNDVSQNVKKLFDRLLKPTLDQFFEEVDRADIRGVVHIDSEIPLPFTLPKRKGRTIFEDLPVNSLLDSLGFKLDLARCPLGQKEIIRKLAPFFEFYYNNSKESDINRWLRRRLHWLGSSI